MNQPWRCGGVCNQFNTVAEIRSIHRFISSYDVNRSCDLSRMISRANARGELKIASKIEIDSKDIQMHELIIIVL